MIAFTNPNLQVKANAFSYLHSSVNVIRFDTAQIDVNNVDLRAFDGLNFTEHLIKIYTNSITSWSSRFGSILPSGSIYGRYY